VRDYTPPPVEARVILRSPVHFIAFGFGAGLSPKGPGTVGTLAGLPFWLFMQHLQWPVYLAVCAGLFAFGCWVCGESAKRLGVHDHGGIVFDEIVGFLVACTPLLLFQASWVWLVAAFVLFRAFDIAKPWPIGWLDRRVHGGVGIMVDDLVAGLMAAFVLTVAALIG
jgi:phosphatidylglycerophosphatase A